MRGQDTTIHQLSDSELETVAGGLNPQPLPPFQATTEQNWRVLSPIFTGAAVTAIAAVGPAVG
jgi:hypothetical protein